MSVFNKERKYLYKTVTVGNEWVFEWYYNEKDIKGCYLLIKSQGGAFSVKINAAYEVFGYLLAALEQNDINQLHGYIAMLYVTAMTLTQDQTFVNDVNKAIDKHLKRLDKKATKAAKSVEEHEETANQALMGDIVSELGMSKKELKAKREADKAEMRTILNEDADKSAEQGQI